MEKNEKKVIVDLIQDSVSKLEKFVDYLCDQLLINESYNGNILVTLSEFLHLAQEVQKNGKLCFSYTTDYQNVTIIVQNIHNQVVELMSKKIDLDDIDKYSYNKSLFLIRSLVDKIDIIDSSSIQFTIDISAIHNKVYRDRQRAINAYFEPSRVNLPKGND